MPRQSLRTATAVLFLLWAAGCSSSSSSPPATATVKPAAIAAEVTSDRLSGSVRTTFDLMVNIQSTVAPIASIEWDMGDGQTASGPTAMVQFAAAGLYEVGVTITDTNGEQIETGVTLTVFPDSLALQLSPVGTPLALVIGDVDGDGQLTLADAHKTLKHITGLTSLIADLSNPTSEEQEAVLAADVDMDGLIDRNDVALMAGAVAAGSTLPESMSPSAGAPGILINLISRHLLDADALITVEVGGSQALEPFRPILGYATFMLPLDAGNRSNFDPVTAAVIPVRILADGTEVASFDFQLQPPAQGGDPIDEILGAVATVHRDFGKVSTTLSTYMQSVGATVEELAILQALLQDVSDRIGEVNVSLGPILQALPADARLAFGLIANANGLQEMLQDLALLPPIAPEEDLSDETILDAICAFHALNSIIGKIDNVIGIPCAGIQIGALIPGPQQPVMGALAAICAGFSIGKGILDVVKDFVPVPGKNLVVDIEDKSLEPGESTSVRVAIKLSLAEGFCVGGLSKLEGALKKKLAETILKRIPIAKIAFAIIKKYPLEQRKELRKVFLDKITKAIESFIGQILSLSGINDALGKLRAKVCAAIIVDPSGRVFLDTKWILDPTPVDAGTFVRSGIMATYTCDPADPAAGPFTVLFDAEREICGKTAKGSSSLLCGQGGSLEICMGDNGSLLDDIFEVKVDGISVLTSNVPVRNICTVLDLAAGDHTVQMIGRAAPDGIGTYFITFLGGTVKSGPPLSGSNLSAGLVFTWIVEVTGS